MNAPVDLSNVAVPAGNEGLRLLRHQRAAFSRDMNPSREVRVSRLNRLAGMIESNADAFCAAIAADFGVRAPVVTIMADIVPTMAPLRHAKRHIGRWMATRRAKVELAWLPGRAKIMRQPLGVVGIVGPWNYPLQLMLCPLVGALAAGNRAMLKPSELTPTFAELLKVKIAKAFAEDEVAVVTGGPEVASSFVDLPFDHLLFTGSTSVGRLVAQAAAKNLVPVTLELGGKSPAIIDASADLKTTAERLAWGKLFNAGQTCIAPDYALVPRAEITGFVAAFRAAVIKQYPAISGNADYTSIISERHAERLHRLIADARDKGAEVVEPFAGASSGKVVGPTLLLDVPPNSMAMREEIFGPVLPIVPYDSVDDAIAYVNERDRPLALYWFGVDPAAREKVLLQTVSGGVCVNDTIAHILQESMPFGGVGPSGQGQYHGEYGFKTFSKEKPVFIQSRYSGVSMMYPPYTGFKRRFAKLLQRIV